MRQQQADGSYTDYLGKELQIKSRPMPGSRLRTTSLFALAILGDGSTLRQGPYRKQLQGAVKWLLGELDERGRFALVDHPSWFDDQALAAFVLAEAVRRAEYRSLAPVLARVVTHQREYLGRKGVRVSPEQVLWNRALAAAMAQLEGEAFALVSAQRPGLLRALAPHEARLLGARPEGELDRAVQLLYTVRFKPELAGKAATQRRLETTGARRGTMHELHPQALAMYTLAIYQVGGAQWKRWQEAMKSGIVQRQLRAGPGKSTWPAPRAGIGPMQTTAWHILAVEAYYRYVKTLLVDARG